MISGHEILFANSIKGAYDFIEKPFDSDLLIFKIKKALENYILKRKLKNFQEKIWILKLLQLQSLQNSSKKSQKLVKLILILYYW